MEFVESRGFKKIPEEERKRIIQSLENELASRKEQGTIDSVDYERNYMFYLCQDGTPVERNRDLVSFAEHPSGQAINIAQEDLLYIKELTGHNLKVVLADGTICEIDPETIGYQASDRIIIFPEELGDLPNPDHS